MTKRLSYTISLEDTTYTYDANGNTTSDLNRGISAIRYDHNNHPSDISFDSGASTRYIYSNDGVKMQTVHRTPTISPAAGIENIAAESTVTSVTDYCGPFVYENGVLTRINLENGYLSYRSVTGQKLDDPEYIFYLRDHLGNNRVTLRGSDNEILQTDHYYPFGLPMGCGYNTSFQQWRFGGKELDRTAGLDLYDFEARALDPTTCRFTTMDPLCENHNPISSYVYCVKSNQPTLIFNKLHSFRNFQLQSCKTGNNRDISMRLDQDIDSLAQAFNSEYFTDTTSKSIGFSNLTEITETALDSIYGAPVFESVDTSEYGNRLTKHEPIDDNGYYDYDSDYKNIPHIVIHKFI